MNSPLALNGQESNHGSIPVDPLAAEVCAELEAEHRRELRRLNDLAFVFLNATDGDKQAAEKLLDDFVELLFDGGTLSTWRYRALLNELREGL